MSGITRTVDAETYARWEAERAERAKADRERLEKSDPPAKDREGAARELTKLLELQQVGVHVVGARIVGQGGGASADLHLSDGTEIVFDSLRDFANPGRLTLEIAVSTGATPRIKAPQAIKAVALLRNLAHHVQTLTADQEAVDWGFTYLQQADVIDVNLTDQAERWAAFSLLRDRAPRATAFLDGSSLAAATTILRQPDGTRLVRCGWFRDVTRQEHPSVSAVELSHRMERVGWLRRGGSGRIKATCPNRAETLVWTFYIVPPYWENEVLGVDWEQRVNGWEAQR